MANMPAADGDKTVTPPLLDVEALKVWFRVGRRLIPGRATWLPAVDGVNFTIRSGGTLGLVGESGSGKSTTARAVAGVQRPTTGSIRLDGEDIVRDGLGPRADAAASADGLPGSFSRASTHARRSAASWPSPSRCTTWRRRGTAWRPVSPSSSGSLAWTLRPPGASRTSSAAANANGSGSPVPWRLSPT